MTGATRSPLQEFLRSRIGGLPRPFWFLWGGTLVNRLGTMVLPFLSLYLTGDRGLSVAEAGAVLAAVGIGQVFSQLIGGVLADRIGRRATLSGAMVVTGATMIALGAARGIPAILVCAALLGLVLDAFRPAAQALVSDLVPATTRARAYGLLLWAVNLGFSVAMVLGGALASAGYALLFWVDAVSCLVFAVLVWRAVPESRGGTGSRSQPGRSGDVLRDRTMLGFVGVVLLVALVFLQCLATLPLAMRADGLSSAGYGLVMAVNGVVIVVLQPLVGHRFDRWDRTRVLAAGTVVLGAGFGLMTFASSTAGYALCVAVWTLGEIVVNSVGVAMVADLAPVHLSGRYNGAYGTAWGIAAFLAPILGTQLLLVGSSVLWTTCLGLCLVAAVAQLMLGPAVRARAPQVPGEVT